MSDSIDRLDTLKAIEDYFNPNHNTDELSASLTKFLVAVGVIISFQPSAQPEPYIDSIVSEIEKTISETRESGKHHDINVRANGEMICYGLQLALEIIEEKRNERSDIQTIGD